MKDEGSFVSKYAKAEFLLYLALVLAIFAIGIDQFLRTTRFADLLYLNSTLTVQDSSNIGVIDRFAAEAEAIITANECRSDILQAGLSFVMKDLDLQDVVNRYDAWAAAMDRANRYVLHALSCNPADGDTWARLALVSQAIGENPQQLSALMSQSVLLSPVEMHTMRARFVVWKRATAATLAISSSSVGLDIRALLNYGSSRDIADILGTASLDKQSYFLALPNSNLNPYISSATSLMPDLRRKSLEASRIVLPAAPAQ